MIKLTVQHDQDEGELDCGKLNGIPRIVSADLMLQVSRTIASHYGGTVRCYDEPDYCVLTADRTRWSLGYVADLDDLPIGQYLTCFAS